MFSGADRHIVAVKRGMQGVILKITARSLAAALLDNEAEPVTYLNPPGVLIEKSHLPPFGITLAEENMFPITIP